jgi:hypothetical protein
MSDYLPVNRDRIPPELIARPQWILWRAELRRGKATKVPYAPDGCRMARVNDAGTWGTFEDVLAKYQAGGFSGIGFVFTVDAGIVGIDVDGCRDPETGYIDTWALHTLNRFNSYAELSPSRTGIKMFMLGSLPTEKTGEKTKRAFGRPRHGKTPGIEAYQRGRFFAVTGHWMEDFSDRLVRYDGELHDWFRETFGTPQTSQAKSTAGDGAGNIVERAKAYLRKLPPAVSGDRGHDRAFHAACILLCDFGLNFEQAWQAIQDWNSTCKPPWSDAELRHKLEDAGKEPVTNRLRDATPQSDTSDQEHIGSLRQRGGAPAGCQDTRHGPRSNGVDLRQYGFDSNVSDDAAAHNHTSDQPGGERKEAPFDKFTVRTLAEQFPRLHPAVIDSLQRSRETMNIISVSKIGKSWLMYSLLLSIVTGRKWLDRFQTTHGRVLLIDNELHKPTLVHRIKTVAEAMGIGPDEYEDDFDVWPIRGRGADIYRIGRELRELDGSFIFIGIDAKYRALPPGTSENDNAAETAFYNEVDTIAELTGAAIGMVHHSTKGSQTEKRITDVGAGAGAQSRAADTHLVLREHEEDDAVVLAAAVRSFAPVDPFGLRFEFPLWVPDDSINPEMLKGRKSKQEETQDRRNLEADGLVIDACPTWRTRREIREKVGMGQTGLMRRSPDSLS